MRLCGLRLRLRLRRRRSVSDADASRPSERLQRAQAEWLAPARARLLRQAQIARRRRVLDLGCGAGAVLPELVRRAGGCVIALDIDRRSVMMAAAAAPAAAPLIGDGTWLPLRDASLDLIFCQLVFVWMDAEAAASEAARVLAPGGVLCALEPDYGGMIEHPPAIAARDVWVAAIARAGGDPLMGRRLRGVLAAAGFLVKPQLLPDLAPPDRARFELLRGLPLTNAERELVDAAAAAEAALPRDAWRVAHLPVVSVLATKA